MLVVVCALVLFGARVVPARAATIAVDCSTDSGALEAALASASDGDTLNISGTCDGTFDISHNLTLHGSGGATLDGQKASTVVVQIDAGMTVNMTDLSITGGFLSGGGTCPGGGVANHGTLTLSNIIISGNLTDYGVCNDVGATLTASNSTISSNGSGFGGAGVLNNGTMTLSSSLVDGNLGYSGGAGGGILNNGTLTITDSTVSGNSGGEGGGIFSLGTLTLTNSTVSGNTGFLAGGGIFNTGPLMLINSTVSGNSASGLGSAGGGIYNSVGGTLTLTNNTVSGNSASAAGGILTQVAATTTLTNTIIAGQTSGGNCAGVGSIHDGGYNLDDDASCGLSAANNSLPNTNPLLDPAGLQDNGGPTQTIALEQASPAIDAIPVGVNGCGTTVATDQRGVTRPQGSACDIGAFELEQQSPAQLLAALGKAVIGVGPGTSLADKIAQAIAYLNKNDITDTCSTLSAFINQVKAQTGKTIPASEAATMSADALQIKTLLGC
jgi:hypothetical protein